MSTVSNSCSMDLGCLLLGGSFDRRLRRWAATASAQQPVKEKLRQPLFCNFGVFIRFWSPSSNQNITRCWEMATSFSFIKLRFPGARVKSNFLVEMLLKTAIAVHKFCPTLTMTIDTSREIDRFLNVLFVINVTGGELKFSILRQLVPVVNSRVEIMAGIFLV